MKKIIFEICEVKETPRSEPKLSIEIKYEPVKQTGRTKELADRIIQAIDEYLIEQNGTHEITEVSSY